MSSPKKNVAYIFYISLIDSADTGAFKANPTIAVGDFQVSGDGAAFANLATLPVVDPAGSIGVKISLSQAEMNFDKIMVQCIDAAGNEWDDVLIFIDATVANVDDVVRSTTPANTLNVAASGEADADAVQIDSSAPAAVNLKQSSLAVRVGTVQTAEAAANTDTIFDTDLPLEAANYYGNDSGGLVIAFITGTAQQFLTRRLVASATGTLNTRITLEEALDGIPADADTFVVLGRITELQ